MARTDGGERPASRDGSSRGGEEGFPEGRAPDAGKRFWKNHPGPAHRVVARTTGACANRAELRPGLRAPALRVKGACGATLGTCRAFLKSCDWWMMTPPPPSLPSAKARGTCCVPHVCCTDTSPLVGL
ncbi:uncharacterized protein LOC135168853 [Diachasmimorpha longicaudata]|uniref:uncharacterized protein LOC135168853 n=1 Tax=Diachasmimorpha longicaudata TaxID=58733 RepID=UPI0030B8A65F